MITMGRHDTAYDGTDPNYYDHQLSVLDESAGRGRYDNELASLDARFGRGALGQGAAPEPQKAQYRQQPLPPFQSPQMSPYQPSPPPQMPSPPQPEAQYQQQPLPPFDPQPMSPYQPSPQAMPQFPPRPRQLYSGDTMSPEFYDGLSFDDPTRVSPRQVMEDGYGSRELFDQSLANAQSYREDNPDLSWVQNLDDETLDSSIPVRSRERGGAGYFRGSHSAQLGQGQPVPFLQAALQHEVGGHGTQGLNTEGNPSPMYPPGVGFDGVQDYDREAALAEGMWTSPSYQLQRIETEARLRGYQQDARKSFEGGYGAYPEDPKNSRTYLEELLYGNQSPYGDEGLDHGVGLPETFQNMSPEEREEFLDYWGPRMPGLVQNENLGMYGSVG